VREKEKPILNEQFLAEIRLKRERVPGFDSYPFCLDAVKALDTLPLHPAVTYIIGENGSGKSTLLEAIAVAWGFNAEGGSRNFNFGTKATHSPLHEYIRLSRGYRKPQDGYFLRAESFYNVATEIDMLDQEPGGAPIIHSYGGTSLHEQSHGESFLALLLHRFSGNSFFVLDEPEAALSPVRQMSALSRIHQLVRDGSQFVIATHSAILMAYPDAWIYNLTPNGIERVSYKETEHYQGTRDFLTNTEIMLDVLFAA
jgi:predicted ATPase